MVWALAALIGVAIPGLTAVVTNGRADARTKALIAGILAGVGAGATQALVSPPHGWHDWWTAALVVLLSWAAAATSWLAAWRPTGATRQIARSTAGFGIGPRKRSAA